MGYLIGFGYLVIWALTALGIHKFKKKKKQKESMILTIGGGFMGSLFIIVALGFAFSSLLQKHSSNVTGGVPSDATSGKLATSVQDQVNSKPSSEEPVIAACNAAVQYFTKSGIPFVTEASDPSVPSIFLRANIPLSGKGLMPSSKPVWFRCNNDVARSESAVDLWGELSVNKNETDAVMALIKKTFLYDSMPADVRQAQDAFLNQKMNGIKADSFGEWVTSKQGRFSLELMTVQMDEAANFSLVVHQSETF